MEYFVTGEHALGPPWRGNILLTFFTPELFSCLKVVRVCSGSLQFQQHTNVVFFPPQADQRANSGGEHFEESQSEEDAGRYGY